MRALRSQFLALARLWGPRLRPAQVLLICSAAITCGFLFFSILVLRDAREDAAQQAEQAAWNISAVIEQDLARNFELFDLSLQAVSDGLQLPGIWDLSPQIRNMILFDRATSATFLGFINALNEKGDVIADSHAQVPRPANFAGRDYFTTQQHDPHNSIYIGRPFGVTPQQPGSIPISRRVSHPDGSFAGVVVGSIRLAYVRDLFAKLALGPHGSIALFRTDGTILMRLPFDTQDVGRIIQASSVFYEFMRTRAPTIEGEAQVDHVVRRFHYRQIGTLPLVLSVGFASEDTFAAWRDKAGGILLVVIVLCTANFGLTIMLRGQLRQRGAAELAARRSEADFRRLTENVSDIVAQIDDNGVYRYVSPASTRILGVPPAEMIGRRIADDLHPDDHSAFELWLARLQHNAAEPMMRYRKRRADGAEVWIEAVASRMVKGQTVAPDGFVIVSRDITARHLLDVAQSERERELEHSNAQLARLAEQGAEAVKAAQLAVEAAEQATAVKTRFLATMSHEVRTPLNSILGYSELLALDGELDPLQAERLAAIREAAKHLRELVNHVLDDSRLEAEASPSFPGRTDLRALAEQCRAQIEPAAAAKGLRLICNIMSDAPRAVFIDATRLRQILINLLQNAVKFTQRGEITLQVSSDTNWLHCAVSDTGPGVPAEQRNRLFHEYDRLDVDRAGIEGSGLGLAIAAQLVKDMGGRIEYDDRPGGGAVFWLEVPILTPGTEHLRMRRRNDRAPEIFRVLLVDDSAANRDVAASFLRGVGHTVIEATDGEEAVHLDAIQDFDIVLMDMHMPGMDGLEAVRAIRRLDGARGRVPVIAVTAHVLDSQWSTWRAAGIDEYLAKPYDRTELLTAMALARMPRGDDEIAPGAVSARAPHPLFDPDVLAELEACMPAEKLAAHQAGLAADIETMVRLLGVDTGDASALAAITHKIAGDAGQLGCMTLSANARQFLAVMEGDDATCRAAAGQLRDAAERSLAALRQRLSSKRNASFTATISA
jgi:PAS domain S-box-containing protein